MANAYRAEGIFGEAAELDDTDRRRWSGKGFIATDDLQKESYLGEIQTQAVMQMLAGHEDHAPQTWVHRKPAMTVGGVAGSRNLITSTGKYIGVNTKFQYACYFNEASSGWDDVPWNDDSTSDYYVQAFGVEVPTDVEDGRDGVLRYSRFKRVVGFSKLQQGSGSSNNNLEMVPGVDAVTQPTSTTLKLDITTQVAGAWALAGGGARQRPVVCWKQNAAQQDGNLGPESIDPGVAVYDGVATSDGVTVTVTVPHTFGQGVSPSLSAGDYTVVVLGPLVDTALALTLDNTLVFAKFDAAGGTFDFEDAPCGPGLKAFAGIWTPVSMRAIGGDVGFLSDAAGNDWIFKSTEGYVWQAKDTGLDLWLEFNPWPLGLAAGQSVVIRKVRIRARTNAAGEYTRVDIIRRDLNGTNLGMVTGGTTDFDNVTTEATIVTDLNNKFVVDPASIGADSQLMIIKIDTSGSPGTFYFFEGADVLWEICDE